MKKVQGNFPRSGSGTEISQSVSDERKYVILDNCKAPKAPVEKMTVTLSLLNSIYYMTMADVDELM